MSLSLKEVAPPVALALAGAALLALGAFRVLPFGNPQPELQPTMQWLLIISGLVLLSSGVYFVWRETRAVARPAAETIPEAFREIQKTAETLRATAERLTEMSNRPRLVGAQSLFQERSEHFRNEKQHLAEHFVPLLLKRCRKFVETDGKQVHLLIDSGTTLFAFFEKLGRETVRAYENREKWTEGLFIETNNLPGVDVLMRAGRTNPNNRYSPLAVNCYLLPGAPLPVYAALTGKRTIEALKRLRSEAGAQAVFMALTTGNWVRLRRSVPVCPVPLARGEGHVEFKQALIDHSDEIYVVTPLGKVFANVGRDELNRALEFDERALDPDRQAYCEVAISSEKAKRVKMVSTSRGPGRVLSQHSTVVRTLLDLRQPPGSSLVDSFRETPIEDLAHVIFPFDKLPPNWHDQLKTEFPHEHTQRPDFQQEFFDVDSSPTR